MDYHFINPIYLWNALYIASKGIYKGDGKKESLNFYFMVRNGWVSFTNVSLKLIGLEEGFPPLVK